MPRKSTMTRQEAGKIGGTNTMKKHGSDFFKKIGVLGGKSRKKILVDTDKENDNA